MKLNKIRLYYHTLRYLKWIQIRYQVWYRLRSKCRYYFNFKYQLTLPSQSASVKLIDWIDKPETLSEDLFKFLNLSHRFENNKINWSFDGFGKLWNYNLNYMDFLLQPNMEKDRGKELINFFVQKINNQSTGLEPYPISLRAINWIKFLTKYRIQDQEVDNSLFAQFEILLDNLEYNLLGNHLLENGFSLLFGAFYFNDFRLYGKAREVIENEINEQILVDGGHFELSPMYHQIILDRILDCINLIHNNERFEGQEKLLAFLQGKGTLMIRWINSMTFSNGQIPMLNDSAPEIAPSTKELNDYAIRLGIIPETLIKESYLNPKLNDSGYRRYNRTNYECIIDVGQIGPDYQSGHGHADTFHFELNLRGRPVISDTGVSTYEKNKRRQVERSTSAHNTVQVINIDSSEIWNGFRVAGRTEVTLLEESCTGIKATHDGYKNVGLIHEREFICKDDSMHIIDSLIGSRQLNAVSRFHFNPDLEVFLLNNRIVIKGYFSMTFKGFSSIRLVPYEYAAAFNRLNTGIVGEIDFNKRLATEIKIICNG